MADCTCPECHFDVACQASACPNCGHPIGPVDAAVDGPSVSSRPPVGIPREVIPTEPRPHLLLGILGATTLVNGLVMGLSTSLRAAATAIQTGFDFTDWLIPALTLLMIPAGIGVLSCRDWGRQLQQALTMGLVIIVGLWVSAASFGADTGEMFIIAPGTTVAVIISLLLNLRSIKELIRSKDRFE